MAKMFPCPIVDFKAPSEERLYQLFKNKIGNDYSVFYGRSWSDNKNDGNPDPECDFIITKPDSGILIVEVKGGRWERKHGNWYANGNYVEYKDNPFEQGRVIKDSLIRILRFPSKWEYVYFPISYAVAIPDSSYSDEFIGLPPTLTFDELSHVDHWLEDAMRICMQSNYPNKTNSQMIYYLQETLMKDYLIKLGDILNIDEKRLMIFTQQQLDLDVAFRKRNRVTAQGCAGSGKTLLAIKQVKRLAQKPEIKNILFTCFNKELGVWLASQTQDLKNCTTMPIVEFFEKKTQESGLISDADKTNDNYYETLPYQFLQANEETLGLKFDAIVVDEGQSFKKDWWDVLETLLVDRDKSHFYIFYDDLQRIYSEVNNPVPGEEHALELTYNIRNTAMIHEQATKFLPQDLLPQSNEITGEAVWFHSYDDKKSMFGALRKVLRMLIQEGRVSSKDIIILTPKKTKSELVDKDSVGVYTLVNLESDNASAIRFTTIQSFRGMERKVVILTELDSNSDMETIKSLIYIGCSRAKTKLVLLVSSSMNENFRNELVNGCQDITHVNTII